MTHASLFRALALLAFALCLFVVVLGAYVRLSDAGLGCPDWPGCYGHMTPLGAAADASADGSRTELIARRSGRPLEVGKAWREMVHRYAAGTLATLLVCLAILALRWRRERLAPLPLLVGLPGLVVVQALFGMLTVTWRLKPLIVTVHLLLGLATLSVLWWLVMDLTAAPAARAGHGIRSSRPGPATLPPPLARRLALLALLALIVQIALGGWTSSNYAATACPDVPTCQGSWWPPADFHSAYDLSRNVGIDANGNLSSSSTLVAIQLTHRLGALAAAAVVSAAALVTLLTAGASDGWAPPARTAALVMVALLALQLGVGITMVLRGFPLDLATAHNAGAALLLLSALTLNHRLRARDA